MSATGKLIPDGAGSLRVAALAVALATSAAPPAIAADTPADPAARQQQPLAPAESDEEVGSLLQRDRLLGDPFGLRSKLESHGITITLQETSEVFGNVTGGFKTGAIYEGATFMALKVDTEKLFGLPGGTFNASAWQIHGRGLSTNNIGNLNTISSIEATRATRLFELWYEQAIADGAYSVRIGQQAADQEFQISQYGGLFINASFGWPTLSAVDQPAGGPAYPLASLGVRLKAQPLDELTFLLGIYSGSPAPRGDGDPQLLNHSGTSFVLNQGVFVIGEAQYSLNGKEEDTGLPGTYKVGFWYNSNQFQDQRYANDFLLLANPASSGVPLGRTNNWAWYVVADQLVWQSGGKDRGIGVFARMTGISNDRNLVNFFVNAGVTWKGGLAARPDDSVGLGIGFARIGDRTRRFDGDVSFYSGSPYPRRTSETVLELTYQAPVTPWLTLQPDFQYIFNPAGGVPDPNNPARTIGSAAIFGLRGVVVF
ncbi:MAG: carbohydrate porin [Proteobacteria bacterium]|nr:carbohydrate porin [Pseudomonadota bacterium]